MRTCSRRLEDRGDRLSLYERGGDTIPWETLARELGLKND
jgi:hypothetical protein